MFKKYQLKNGLKVLLIESRKSPVVSVQMWVNTGSADEGPGEEGISHFIEHLVFKGTRKFKLGELAAKVEGAGGEINAYTSFDETVFYVTISKSFINTGLEVIAEMMGHPSFVESEIDNEREVVIEEIKRGNDNPHRRASQALFSTVYKKHPYSLPVIGFEENIRKVSRQTLLNYFHSRYVPRNMTLLIVGDFDLKEMQKQVDKHYGDFADYKLKKVARKPEPVQKQPRQLIQQGEFEETLFHLAWPIPVAAHKDVAALDVLALILGQGDSSRLNEKVRLQDHAVNYIGASSFTPRNPGFFAISGSLNAEKLATALAGVQDVLRRLKEEPPRADELQKAIINFNSDDFYNLETVDRLARKYGHFEHLFGDYKKAKSFLAQINAVTVKDILRVAKKYLVPGKINCIFLTSEDPKQIAPVLKTFLKNFGGKRESLLAKTKIVDKQKRKKIVWYSNLKKSDQNVKKITLPQGGTVLLRPDFETPVIHLRSAFLGGLRVERASDLGITELLSRVWTSGAQSMNEEEIARKTESLASSLSGFGGRNSMGLSLTTLHPFAREVFEIFSSLLTGVQFSEQAIDREKAQMKEYLRTRSDNPAQVCILNFMSTMFGHHPYGRDAYGTNETIDGLTREKLNQFYKSIVRSKNFHVSVAGHIDVDEWQEMMSGIDHSLAPGDGPDMGLGFSAKGQTQRVYTESKKQQSHIVLGVPGLTFQDPRRFTLHVLQSILSGQGGRLFLELRDKASLAYSVAPIRMEGLDCGYFGTYIGCSPEKATQAIQMMRAELQKVADKEVGDNELERAKRYLIGRHDIDLQKNSAISSAVLFDDLYGVDFQETFHFAKKITAVSKRDVRALAEDLFKEPEVLSCVGASCPW